MKTYARLVIGPVAVTRQRHGTIRSANLLVGGATLRVLTLGSRATLYASCSRITASVSF